VILSWPLTVGKQWSSGGYDFLVVSQESVITPYQEYKESYKVAYMETGSADPLGQYWVVGGIGRGQIEEAGDQFRMTRFETGEGPTLSITPPKVVATFLEKASPRNDQISGESSIKKTWFYIQNSKMFPLLIVQVVILLIFLIVGVVLWQALR